MKKTVFRINSDYEFRNGRLMPIETPDFIQSSKTDSDFTGFDALDRAGYEREMDLPGDIAIWFNGDDGVPYVSVVTQHIGGICVDVYLPTLGDYFEYMNLTRGHRDALAADLKSFKAERESGTA